MSYTVTLIKKELVAKDTMAFYFSKPDGFTYKAGQYADYTLINPPETDAEGNKRTFSFASAPYEDSLMITTRLRDTAFKRTLQALKEGSPVQLDGPFGSFALPQNPTTPAVLIAGGIGCTFARSMLLQAVHDKAPNPITLFSSNYTKEDAPFFDLFTNLAARHENITFIPTMTNDAHPSWTGEREPISMSLIAKYLEDPTVPTYYLSGTGEMVNAMRTMLLDAGVNRFNIRIDNFVGYS
ncbi:MAG TPA: FAD-dependent oxidoreductase [Candidatus Saccharimonadales bacterium]|nr:FAD-dependent oxidoreductase [Candidatus Saccharimonadales bacterium]